MSNQLHIPTRQQRPTPPTLWVSLNSHFSMFHFPISVHPLQTSIRWETQKMPTLWTFPLISHCSIVSPPPPSSVGKIYLPPSSTILKTVLSLNLSILPWILLLLSLDLLHSIFHTSMMSSLTSTTTSSSSTPPHPPRERTFDPCPLGSRQNSAAPQKQRRREVVFGLVCSCYFFSHGGVSPFLLLYTFFGFFCNILLLIFLLLEGFPYFFPFFLLELFPFFCSFFVVGGVSLFSPFFAGVCFPFFALFLLLEGFLLFFSVFVVVNLLLLDVIWWCIAVICSLIFLLSIFLIFIFCCLGLSTLNNPPVRPVTRETRHPS